VLPPSTPLIILYKEVGQRDGMALGHEQEDDDVGKLSLRVMGSAARQRRSRCRSWRRRHWTKGGAGGCDVSMCGVAINGA